MHGLLRLQEKVRLRRAGKLVPREAKPEALDLTRPSIPRVGDPARDAALDAAQESAAMVASSLDRSDEPASDEVAEAPAARVAGEAEGDLDALLREHGVTETPKDAAPIVPVDRHVSLARRLRDGGYAQLVYVAATHFPAKTGAKPQPERFEVAYALRTVGKGTRLAAWRLLLAPGESAPSLVGVFAGADWQEREQYDLVGIRFDGHPDLRRIMLPDTWQGHPLRRDYPADTACPPWR
jgi:NADH-quinone oxidoreductase subunit C